MPTDSVLNVVFNSALRNMAPAAANIQNSGALTQYGFISLLSAISSSLT
jgi:hypothetical protein